MEEIRGKCTKDVAQGLAAKGLVKGMVLDRLAVVDANAWEPVTGNSDAAYYVTARLVVDEERDMVAKGTIKADVATQKLIDAVTWEPWLE